MENNKNTNQKKRTRITFLLVTAILISSLASSNFITVMWVKIFLAVASGALLIFGFVSLSSLNSKMKKETK
jgi:hypothetical protein